MLTAMVSSMDEITIVEVAPQKVIGKRKRGNYTDISDLIPEVFEYVDTNNIQIQGPPVYLCHETSAEAVEQANAEGTADLEVAVPIAGDVPTTEEYQCYDIPGGKMAKIVHTGPYETVGETYEKLFHWLTQHNYQVTGPLREVYISDPSEVAPEELLTEIYAPIA